MNLPEAAEQFVAVWADPRLARDIAGELAPREVETLANLLRVMGEPEVAEQWLTFHTQKHPERVLT